MSTLRQQFLRRVVIDIAGAGAVTTVDILGPESPLEPPYAENTDHVIRDRQVRQNEAGFVVITEPTNNLDTAAEYLFDVEIWSRASSAAQKGLEAALFPSGAPAPADPVLKRVVSTAIPGADVAPILGGAFGGADNKDVPLLHVRADEFVRLLITENGGGAAASTVFEAKFDLGISAADSNRLA